MVSPRTYAAFGLLAVIASGCATTQRSPDGTSPYASGNTGPGPRSFIRSVTNAASNVVKKSPAELNVYRDVNYISKDDPTSLNYKPGPIGANVYTSAAALMEQKGDLGEAAKHYHRALEADPRDRSALIGLGRLYHRAGSIDEAISTYQTALKTYRDDAVIMNDLGLCYARNGRLQDAVATLNSAVQIQPDRTMYRNNLATVLVEAGRLDEARAHLARAHGDAVAHYNVGYLLNRQGKYGQAMDQLNKALQLDPHLQVAQKLHQDVSSQLRTAAAPKPTPVSPAILHQNTPYVAPNTGEPASSPAPSSPAAYQDRGGRVGPFGYLPRSPREKAALRQPSEIQHVSYEEPASFPNTGDPAWPIRLPTGRVTPDSVGYVPPTPPGAAALPWKLPAPR